jgi:hypothetical protein
MKYLLLLITVFMLMIQWSQAQNYSLDDFEEISLPVPYNKLWYELNNKGDQSFKVSIINGNLQINKEGQNRSPVKYKVASGNLIGEDHGEFGGGLFYEPADTNVKQVVVNGKLAAANGDAFIMGMAFVGKYKSARAKLIPVKRGNVKAIFDYKGSFYTVEGLAHMSSNYGSFTRVEIKENDIAYKDVLKLDDAPMAYAIHRGAIYLATFERFYIIRDWKPQLIADKLFWQALYPNSVAVKNSKHIYFGMRAGYAMVNADSGKVTFYRFKELK